MRPSEDGRDWTAGLPDSATPASRSSSTARSVVSGATPAVRSSSTCVRKPSRAASRAVARTQWSVAMPTTSTSSTSRARSQSASVVPFSSVPSKPL